MPVNANFGIMQPVDVGGSFMQAFQYGKQQRAQSETQNALTALAQDPQADVNALAKYNPQLLMQINQQRAQQQQAKTVGDALTGNADARGQVAYFDPDLYMQLQGEERKQAKDAVSSVAQAALWADTPQKWDAIVGQMTQSDPAYQQYIGRFAEREAIIAQAGEIKALLEQNEPSIGYVPADAQAYAKNAAGETVLQALNGQQPQPAAPPPPGFVIDEGGPASAPGSFPQADY
ncbi:hypothetical protein [Sphingorhabdus sp. SMR4y]|uniref:hypothetical protein n=1 Tax=Sphingorhabdus sp. SMR4y TaxID=2584094 RepID=UPI000B622910|nr:hypothetical protein [Sphingorhabdus sp. SMR4y]ASK88458.1 hypothetical protein SPHFLASMR4Y_01711 [Sphingorhabdus sp. SMR4y]